MALLYRAGNTTLYEVCQLFLFISIVLSILRYILIEILIMWLAVGCDSWLPVCVLYSTASDPQPQMIPRPQMIPKMDRK